ncbi:hypothetical protein N7481_009237 [Penicillium waksmanii]|uniref:uncharacterized protein n=1 Tax=Penicillium waksmanii TaxID=69791 RepID=UPI002548EDBC|nr:uncharacterized protein N7481_009237 [Penicillium waksmanii]KAJ5975530.1 hypothetical protein N7481_009237 [Penicillium waksmanii]
MNARAESDDGLIVYACYANTSLMGLLSEVCTILKGSLDEYYGPDCAPPLKIRCIATTPTVVQVILDQDIDYEYTKNGG